MRLAVRELEKVDGVAEPVAREPFRPQHGVLEGNRERRLVGANRPPLLDRLPLDFLEGSQGTLGIALERLGPPAEPLLTRHRGFRRRQLHRGDAAELT